MREIKFRLRSPINKIVGYEKWFPGSMDSKNFYVAEPCWLYSKDGKFWNPKKIDHRNKDEFTGLLDKNDVMIFEGDILKNKAVICFRRGRFIGVYDGGTMAEEMEDEIYTLSLEIIGNIYENPSLLEPGV